MQNDEFRIDITKRTIEFAVKVIILVNLLPKTPAGYAIASQIVRSGTSIGANIQEAQSAHSKKDFIHCLTISLKEARETYYWLTLIQESKLVLSAQLSLLMKENDEIIRILVTIIRKSKINSEF